MGALYTTTPAGGSWLPNDVAKNPNITTQALGLYMVMLAMHPMQAKTRDTLTGRGMGRRSVADALRNLEDVGLRYRFKYLNKRGQWHTVTVLCTSFMSPWAAFQFAKQRVQAYTDIANVLRWHDRNGVEVIERELSKKPPTLALSAPPEIMDSTEVPEAVLRSELGKQPDSTEVPEAVLRYSEPVDNLPVERQVEGETLASSDGEVFPALEPNLNESDIIHRGTGTGTLNKSIDLFSIHTPSNESNHSSARETLGGDEIFDDAFSAAGPDGPSGALKEFPASSFPLQVQASGSTSTALGNAVDCPKSAGQDVGAASPMVVSPDIGEPQPTQPDAGELDVLLARQALPEPYFAALTRAGLSEVGVLLRGAQADGWPLRVIYEQLNERGSLDGAKAPGSLVVWRLKDVLAGDRPISIAEARQARIAKREQIIRDAKADLEAIMAGRCSLDLPAQSALVFGYESSPVCVEELGVLLMQARDHVNARRALAKTQHAMAPPKSEVTQVPKRMFKRPREAPGKLSRR